MNKELKRTIDLLDKLTHAVKFYNWYDKKLHELLSALLYALSNPNCRRKTLKNLNDRLEKI